MAITRTHWELLKEFKKTAELPDRPRILEIGQANVYGDFDPQEIANMLPTARRQSCRAAGEKRDLFALAKFVYEALFHPGHVAALDAGGPDAHKIDLNIPRQFAAPFDLVINHGTAEHIFDVGSVFRTMHNAAAVGGYMIHEAPCLGWLDHGFYCLQPTLFWDVARVNGYEVVMAALEHLQSATADVVTSREQILELRRRDHLAKDLMLFVVVRKTRSGPFVVPTQGVYCGQVSPQSEQAWRELR